MDQKHSKTQTQRTNDSSIVSKNSASICHYFEDNFLKHFVTKPSKGRSPLINRGYYVRVKAIDLVVSTFLNEHSCSVQLVSFGAGFDTLYFRHRDMISASGSAVFEIDFPSVISQKYQLICESQELVSNLSVLKHSSLEVFAFDKYFMIGCDLAATEKLDSLLSVCGVDYSVPTLFISECALTYVEPKSVDRIMKWITSSFSNCLFCCYEQILPSDGFGQIMKKHFNLLGSPLKNIDLYPSKAAQGQRVLTLGFSSYFACNMNELYNFLPVVERKRIDLLEPFDEFEEFYLKCSHYTLMCANKGNCQNVLEKFPQAHPSYSSDSVVGDLEMHFIALSKDSTPLKRYGHSSIYLPSGEVVIIAGFGISKNCKAHKRLNDVLLFSMNAGKYTCKTLTNFGDAPDGIVHHRAVLLDDGRILVTGGRSSPIHPQQDSLVVTVENFSEAHWKITKLSDRLPLRWRHSATRVIFQGKECVVMAGGCTTNCTVLNDIVLIRISDWGFSKLPITLRQGTHSHSAVVHESSIIIAGGLNEEMIPLETCYRISFETCDWSMTQVMLPHQFAPRFSCGSFVDKDKFYLVGGVGRMEDTEVLVINLESEDFKIYKIKLLEEGIPVLLHSFTVHCIGDGILWLFGGGGNCFSFGTHFNSSPMQLTVP